MLFCVSSLVVFFQFVSHIQGRILLLSEGLCAYILYVCVMYVCVYGSWLYENIVDFVCVITSSCKLICIMQCYRVTKANKSKLMLIMLMYDDELIADMSKSII